MILSLNATTVPWLNRLLLKYHKIFGEFDSPTTAKNLPHGVKFKIEEGVGIHIVPRTAFDNSLEIL